MIDMTALVIFSRQDDPFLDKCLEGLLPSCSKVIAVAYDKLWDGRDQSAEVQEMIERNRDKGVEFIVLPFDQVRDPNYHCNQLRQAGLSRVTSQYVMFIDADEIFVPGELKAWQEATPPGPGNFLFSCYFYFREVTLRATAKEQILRVVRKDLIDNAMRYEGPNFINRGGDRHGLAFGDQVEVHDPVVHHFSWTRRGTKADPGAGIREKVIWGHRHDRDWNTAITEEYSRPFNGGDYVHGYSYEVVDNQFSLDISPRE